MKDPFIFLCPEITRQNALTLIEWMRDEEVRKYLSDNSDVSADIQRVVNKVNLPDLTHLFCNNGRFYMVYNQDRVPVGFIRLIVKGTDTEIVIVIGDRGSWGKKLGTSAIIESLKVAFLELRSHRLIAKIHKDNTRSLGAFINAGFKYAQETASMKILSMTMQEYLELLRNGLAAPGVIYVTEIDRVRLRKLIDDELKSSEAEKRIKELETEINRARIVKPHKLPGDVITMNSRALLSLNGKETEVSLVYPYDSDPANGNLSVLSPIGTAILGYSEGDDIRWDITGDRAYIRIKELLYQPEAAGHYHL